jgi:hypothetical protein
VGVAVGRRCARSCRRRGLPRRVADLRRRRFGRDAVLVAPWLRARGSTVVRAARCRAWRADVEARAIGPPQTQARQRYSGASGEEVAWCPTCGEGERD